MQRSAAAKTPGMGGWGVWRWGELRAALGATEVRRRVAAGLLTRVAYGWYAAPSADPVVVTAVRLGGHLGCLSACRLHGLWVPPESRVHVSFNRRVPMALPAGVAAHADREIGHEPAVRPLQACLEEVVRHHSTETALIVLDSALNRRLITESEVLHLVARCPAPKAAVVRYLDRRAESGSETRVRYFFQRRRVPVEPQVQVPGVGRVDLRIGRCLMVECDSREHHTAPENYQRDRLRDLVLVADGRRVVRLTYEQVFFQWPVTQQFLSRLVQLRLHRSLPFSAR